LELGFLSDPRDGDAMWAAMSTAQDMIAALQQRDGFACIQLMPGVVWRYARSQADFRQYLSRFGAPFYHVCGTCSMPCGAGKEEEREGKGEGEVGNKKEEKAASSYQTSSTSQRGVVDARLRVRGVRALRVADASVFPRIPTAPIAATCMAVAAAAAEFLLEGDAAAAELEVEER
jgi:hypothetical protein